MTRRKVDWDAIDAVVRKHFYTSGPKGCKAAYPSVSEWSFRKSARRQGIEVSEEYRRACARFAHEKSRLAQIGRVRPRKVDSAPVLSRREAVARLREIVMPKAKLEECLRYGVNPYGSAGRTMGERL